MNKIIRNSLLFIFCYVGVYFLVFFLDGFLPFDLGALFATTITPIFLAFITGFAIGFGFYVAKDSFEKKK